MAELLNAEGPNPGSYNDFLIAHGYEIGDQSLISEYSDALASFRDSFGPRSERAGELRVLGLATGYSREELEISEPDAT